MCIALLSTAHPTYPFILLSNRDEFLSRPTARADWWESPLNHVLGGRDLQRPEQGTWLGITKQGRLAVLTNFRDEGVEVAHDKSRGAIVKAYLALPPGQQEEEEEEHNFAKHLIEDVGIYDVGGLSLLYGRLRKDMHQGLAILSNRTASPEDLVRIAAQPDKIYGLSNSFFGDRSWPKVVNGEQLLEQAIKTDLDGGQSRESFIESLFDVLCVDTLPKHNGEAWDTYTRQLRNSILIPPVGGSGIKDKKPSEIATADAPADEPIKVGKGIYGTQKQTVLLVDQSGKVTYVERTLFDESGARLSKEGMERSFEFTIEGW